MYTVYVYIGAQWVNEGSIARTDSSGWPACEQCGRRLSKCRGKKYKHGHGQCCVNCYTKREGYRLESIQQSKTQPVPQLHKKKQVITQAPVVPVLTYIFCFTTSNRSLFSIIKW